MPCRPVGPGVRVLSFLDTIFLSDISTSLTLVTLCLRIVDSVLVQSLPLHTTGIGNK
jgi:hypothetical protein